MEYPEDIVGAVRQNLGLEPNDKSQDERIYRMSHDEVFDRVATWAGLINYGGAIRHWVCSIYNVDLR